MPISNDYPTNHTLATDLEEIALAVQTHPNAVHRARANAALGRIVEGLNRQSKVLSMVNEAISQLRLDFKYIVFDLESTRQERDELRQRFGR